MSLVGLILLIVLLIALLPTWPYSNAWGYRPSGVVGLLLLILILFLLFSGPAVPPPVV